MMFAPEEFLDLSCTEHRVIFDNLEAVWQALPKVEAYLKFSTSTRYPREVAGRPFVGSAVFIGKGTVVEQGALIKGPAWIGEDCHHSKWMLHARECHHR